MLSEEDQFRALKLLERNPSMTQREIAVELGVSVGKAHYVVTELINLGWLKLRNFRRSDNKLGYSYLLTPTGIVEKAAVTARFLVRKQDEYEALRLEIEQLKSEVANVPPITGRR
ncbi:MarR family EPS-associated transcriptional regulator [Porticoccaceae bacterium]|nr:MarR family EPS-associated transcriptional regulator [Porticoccaceae bacterium]